MITETDIRQWADRKEAQSLLPVMVRKLIRETTLGLSYIRFPGNDAVALHGVDGETETDAPTPWVPKGKAYWEMGCDQSPGSKANSDYDKRVSSLDVETRRSKAFVFVTPRRWPGKEEWLKDRRARGDWAEVHAWDAVDLETWLDEAPATRVWLAEMLGSVQAGITSPEDWFRSWASASSPNVTQRLVADRRGGVAKAFMQKLRDGDRSIPVVADSRQEAVAFCVASLDMENANDLLDRMVVITSPDAEPSAGNGPKPILILDLPQGEKPARLDRDRFQTIHPMAKGEAALREQLELPHIAADVFREELEGIGFSRDEAQRLALEVGHSVTVLRRRLSDDPAVRLPRWAQEPDMARKLLPFALVGGWVQSDDQDDLSLLALLSDASEDNILRAGIELAKGEDAPLARIGSVTMAVSQLDALFAVGPYIEASDLDRFFLLSIDALGERDPKLDLPEDEWWCANIHGKSRTYSGALLSGLGDTLGILATYGDAICGNRLNVNLQGRIDRHVRDLMSEMTPDAWVSIRPHLRAVAEAAPLAFLDCVEADLARPDQPISAIMRTVGAAGISQSCLRVELLWALEALAWSPKYFPRVAEILFRLRAFDVDDNHVNNPANSAKAIFRDWLPSTTLDVEGKISVLRRLAHLYRSPAIDVCKSLIESGPRFASRTTMPRWLAVEGEYDVATNVDCWKIRRAASELLLNLAPLNLEELRAILEIVDCLHPDDLHRLRDEVERWSKDNEDQAKTKLANVVRTKLGQLQFRHQQEDNDGVAQSVIPTLEQILGQLQPQDLRHRHLWLFEEEYVQWPSLESDEASGKINWRERDELVQGRRHDALREIETAYGADALYEFSLELEHPHIAARVLTGPDVPQEQTIDWAIRAITDAGFSEKSEKFLAQVLFIHDETALAVVVAALEEKGLLTTQEDKERLGRCLPNRSAGWRLAERIGGYVKSTFWSNVHIQIFGNEDFLEVEFVIRRLLEAGRPRYAFQAARHEPENLSADLWVEILNDIAQCSQDEGPLPNRWHLVRILKQLDEAPGVSDEQIAALEWPFAKLLGAYGEGSDRPVWAIHRLLEKNPAEYIGLLRYLYRRTDDSPEADLEEIEADQLRIRADLAFQILHGWAQIPGTRDDGSLDEKAFLEWIDEMLKLAQKHGRLRPALSGIADCLARVAKESGFENWLPDVVLKFLDRSDMTDLRRSFEIGAYNTRGTTMRSPYDGGAQERELAEKYRELAGRKSNDYPRVAAMLDSIATGYDQDAKRHDEEAQLGERWHP